MKFNFGLLISMICLILSSCAEKKEGEQKTTLLSHLVSITDNEDKGVKEVLAYYGGYCEYSIGISASTDEGSIKYFEIKVSKSEALEQYANMIQMPASNIAFLFYKNLKEEKDNYDQIRTVILFADGEEMTFSYSQKELEEVKQRIPLIDTIVELIKNKEFEKVSEYLNDQSIYNYNKSELVTNLEKVDPNLGKVIEFLPYGFRINNTDNGDKILHVSGMVKRDLQSHEFSADFDLNTDIEELLKIDYKF